MTVTTFLGDRRQTTDILKRRFLVFNKSCRGSQRLQTLWKVITSQLRLCKRAVRRRREAELLCKARAEACGAAAAGLPDTYLAALIARPGRSPLLTLHTQNSICCLKSAADSVCSRSDACTKLLTISHVGVNLLLFVVTSNYEFSVFFYVCFFDVMVFSEL